MQRLKRPEQGFGMIEVLLAIGIALMMLTGISKLMSDARREMGAQSAAETLRAFQTAAQSYYEAHREAILKVTEDGTEASTYCQVQVGGGSSGVAAFDTGKHTCAFDASLLKARLLLPANARETNDSGERLVAILRQIYAEGEPTGHAEILIVAADASPDHSPGRHEKNLAVVANLGHSGGLVPDRDRGICNAHELQVCGNGWQIQLDNFLGAEQIERFKGQLQR